MTEPTQNSGMAKLLIIRSVSFQQLDKALPVMRQAYPGARVELLTHEHGVAQAHAMPGIDGVRVYPYRGGFSWWRPVPVLRGEMYDAVVVPVANATGAGFWNVCLFALTIKARTRVLCKVTSELTELTRVRILAGALKRGTLVPLAALGAVMLGLVVLPILPLLLWRMRARRE
jgi:hypothetical protein